VTVHPGLVPALLVGVSYARGLAAARDLPCVPINHFLAHIYGAFLGDPERLGPGSFPALALVVSGGHTALLRVDVDGSSHLLGQTLDDAAGEAFDKAAKILGLGYPGGPVIDRLAAEGDPGAFPFPRGLVGGQGRRVRDEDRFNFSFSGVKTSLLYRLPEGRPPEGQELRDLVASYQGAIVDVLAEKAVDAAIHTGAATLVLCGGVACNSALRREVAARAGAQGVDVVIAPPRYCTDNAAMVAGLAWHYLRHDVRGSDQVGARLPAEAARVPFAPGFQRGVSVSR
jgi:N6-L-threonylcarbamoyladenine synthase